MIGDSRAEPVKKAWAAWREQWREIRGEPQHLPPPPLLHRGPYSGQSPAQVPYPHEHYPRSRLIRTNRSVCGRIANGGIAGSGIADGWAPQTP